VSTEVFDKDFSDDDLIKPNAKNLMRKAIIFIFLERLPMEKGTFRSGMLTIGKPRVGKWSPCDCLEKDAFV
jgi:hypothetical protein